MGNGLIIALILIVGSGLFSALDTIASAERQKGNWRLKVGFALGAILLGVCVAAWQLFENQDVQQEQQKQYAETLKRSTALMDSLAKANEINRLSLIEQREIGDTTCRSIGESIAKLNSVTTYLGTVGSNVERGNARSQTILDQVFEMAQPLEPVSLSFTQMYRTPKSLESMSADSLHVLLSAFGAMTIQLDDHQDWVIRLKPRGRLSDRPVRSSALHDTLSVLLDGASVHMHLETVDRQLAYAFTMAYDGQVLYSDVKITKEAINVLYRIPMKIGFDFGRSGRSVAHVDGMIPLVDVVLMRQPSLVDRPHLHGLRREDYVLEESTFTQPSLIFGNGMELYMWPPPDRIDLERFKCRAIHVDDLGRGWFGRDPF